MTHADTPGCSCAALRGQNHQRYTLEARKCRYSEESEPSFSSDITLAESMVGSNNNRKKNSVPELYSFNFYVLTALHIIKETISIR